MHCHVVNHIEVDNEHIQTNKTMRFLSVALIISLVVSYYFFSAEFFESQPIESAEITNTGLAHIKAIHTDLPDQDEPTSSSELAQRTVGSQKNNAQGSVERSHISLSEEASALLETIELLEGSTQPGVEFTYIQQVFHEKVTHAPSLLIELAQWLESLPENGTKDTIIHLLSVYKDRSLESFALEKVFDGDDQQQSNWLRILSTKGINDSNNRAELSTRLSSISSEHNLELAIIAVGRGEVADGAGVARLLWHLEKYADNPSAGTRAAVATSVGTTADSEMKIDYLLGALGDESPVVRQSVLSTLRSSSESTDPKLKPALFHVLTNRHEDIDLRILAGSILERFVLTESEKKYLLALNTQLGQEETQAL